MDDPVDVAVVTERIFRLSPGMWYMLEMVTLTPLGKVTYKLPTPMAVSE